METVSVCCGRVAELDWTSVPRTTHHGDRVLGVQDYEQDLTVDRSRSRNHQKKESSPAYRLPRNMRARMMRRSRQRQRHGSIITSVSPENANDLFLNCKRRLPTSNDMDSNWEHSGPFLQALPVVEPPLAGTRGAHEGHLIHA